MALDLTLLDADDRLVPDLELERVSTAKAHAAQTCSRLRSIPGVGKSLALVRLDELHAIHRFPRVQAFVAACRLVTGTQEAAGTRDGTSDPKIGHASRTWAVSEAAVRCLHHHPAGQKSRSGDSWAS
jgi:transposase